MKRLVRLETAVAYFTPPPSGRAPFAYLPGDLPILLSAPHGASHRRRHRIKKEEGYTSAIARLVAEETGAHALYSRFQSESDPNWDRLSPYKTFLKRLIEEGVVRFVLDIHGMSNRHKIGMALGTINGASCPEHEALIVRTLKKHGFLETSHASAQTSNRPLADRFVVNHPRFTGGVKSHTVTRFVCRETRAVGAQLELASSIRVVEQKLPGQPDRLFRGDPARIQATLRALIALVRDLSATYR